MNKTLVRRPKDKEESLINWSVVSKILTGTKENLRQNRVPKKHKEEVDALLHYVECWKEGKKLITPDDFKQKIRDIDLLSVIMDDK